MQLERLHKGFEVSKQPSGTVTFLFTDIEGSTKRWEKQPVAMAKAVARHDELMRTAIAQHRGHVFKTVGDAFCAVFPTAEDAVAATLTAQRALAEEQWGEIGPIRVRMALHTGEAEERDADYFGPPVNRVARLVSAGHGGQTLLSEATGEHVAERLPGNAKLRSLGKHRLKDLARPERILQLIADGLPSSFPRLKTAPSPYAGLIAAVLSSIIALVSFRVSNRSSSEGIDPGLLSPLSLYLGFKGLVIELSTLHEYVLLTVGGAFLLLAIAIAVARWRTVRRELALKGEDSGTLRRMVVNQRTVAFLGLMGLTVLGAYAYQQYLWNVALPVPKNALGIAMTREASAATVQEQLADSLYTQGQAEQVIVRQLPVSFDARDTDKARAMGDRLGARAVVIYRTDEAGPNQPRQYVAYVVFTEPRIGLTIGGASQSGGSGGEGAGQQPVLVKEGVPVPMLRTDTLDELINGAAGIIAYDDNRPRKAIEHLELAMPDAPDAPNTGILNFYLGNAYHLDNQPDLATIAYERAATFYEGRLQRKENLGPQDQLVLVKTYLERGWLASFAGDLDGSLAWYQKALQPRTDLLARAAGLERPTDVHGTYARLYTLMADTYRFQELAEDQRSWEQRALEEIDAVVAMAGGTDQYAFVQEGIARVFMGDCAGAARAMEQAIALDPTDVQALSNAGIVAVLQERPDLARGYWQRIIDQQPEDIPSRELIAITLVMRGLPATYSEPAYLREAESMYREIIGLDPTNIDARRELADVANLRADMSTLDSTALSVGDDLAVAKSQEAWSIDPERRQAALDDYAVVIDERRVLALELQPGLAEAEASVAEAYMARQILLYSVLSGLMLSGTDNPEKMSMGKQVLADAEQIREWTDRALANPSASRLDALRAWAARVESLEREWGWYRFFEANTERSAALEEEYRQAVRDAIAFGEAQPIGGLDEIAPLRIVYFKARFIASALDADEAAAATLDDRINNLTQEERQGRREGITHYTTFCNEAREQEAGDALLIQGDAPGAEIHFKNALKANPHHVDSLLGLGAARFQQGDVADAIGSAAAATVASPNHADAWDDLGIYRLANGETGSASDAFDRFLVIAGTQPPQERMATIGEAIDGFEDRSKERPELVPGILQVLPQFSQFLDGMASEGTGSYQFSGLYLKLGELALYGDQAPLAEPLFRRSIEFDPHLPQAHADLVISVLVQNRDASREIEAAFAESGDPFWSRIAGYDEPGALLGIMEDRASAYVDRFPECAALVGKFTSLFPAEEERLGWKRRGVEGNAFTSAYLGYVVSWDDSWTVADAATDPFGDTDLLLISNGISTLQVGSSTMDSPEPTSCLDDLIGSVDESEGWKTVTPALDGDGRQVRVADANRAYAAFLDQPGDGSAASVYYLECRPLPTSQAFLTFLLIVPANQYESQAEPIERVLASIEMAEPEAPASTPVATPNLVAPAPVSLPELDLEAFTSALVGFDGSIYTSPGHGYSLEVGRPWALSASSSDNGEDALELTDGTSQVFLDVFPESDNTPGACVRQAADELVAAENVSDVRVLRGEDGTPLRGSDANSAFMVYAYHIEAEDATAMDSTMYVDCRRLPDGAVLRILHVGSQDEYDTEAESRETLLAGLVITGIEDDVEATPVSAVPADSGGLPVERRGIADAGLVLTRVPTVAEAHANVDLSHAARAPMSLPLPGSSAREVMHHA